MLKPDRDVGIVGYGAYVPRYRLPAAEVARVWTDGSGGLPIKEKAVAGLDEDTLTMSIEAARNALARAQIDPQELRAVWVGSESHPYAVKPTSTIVAEAIGATPYVQAADLEFACKAGSEAIVMGIGIVGSGMGRYVLAIGMDTAQGRPGDALEYTAASGGAAFIVGPAEESVAVYEAMLSHVTDTPDFWRRAYAHYPSHGHRFTGEPAYFEHLTSSARAVDGRDGHAAVGLHLCGLSPAEHQIPAARGRDVGLHPGADQDRAAGVGHRQHLRRLIPHRPDRDPGYRPAGRPHLHGLVRLRRRLRCLLHPGDRPHP